MSLYLKGGTKSEDRNFLED